MYLNVVNWQKWLNHVSAKQRTQCGDFVTFFVKVPVLVYGEFCNPRVCELFRWQIP